MALLGQFGQVLSNALGAFSTLPGGVGTAGQFGSAVLSSFTQPTANYPMVSTGPVVQTAASSRALQSAGAVAGAFSLRKALLQLIAPILIKIATATGRKTMTLRQAVKIIKKAAKWIETTAIAASLGITVGEVATLLMADAARARRRMNPANVNALRRSMRRLASFHRLCVKADTLRRGRARRPAPRCGPGLGAVVRNG